MTMAPAGTMTTAGPVDVAPDLLEQWMRSGETVVVDVREDFEHAEERIAGAVLVPLSKFDPALVRSRAGDRRVVFHCRSGKRSTEAANRYRKGDEQVFHLAGGIEGWKAAGRPVQRAAKGPRIPLMRQVLISAGFLVALGVGLGVAVSPWFLALAGFVGCGLMFAGITGWCGMAFVLARMPWNKGLKSCGASCSAR